MTIEIVAFVRGRGRQHVLQSPANAGGQPRLPAQIYVLYRNLMINYSYMYRYPLSVSVFF